MRLIFYVESALITFVSIDIIKSSGKSLIINTLFCLLIAGLCSCHSKTEAPVVNWQINNLASAHALSTTNKDSIAFKLDALIKHGDALVDSIKAGNQSIWSDKYFYYTIDVFDNIKAAENLVKDDGLYQTKWFILTRGRHVDGDRKYDSTFALNASQSEVEWLKNLKGRLDRLKAK